MSAIKVVAYDPAWPSLFEREKRRLVDAIGNMVEDIHHVGSTSIIGLAAKPKIDIDTVLRSDLMIADAVAGIKSLGTYHFHGDPYDDGMWTFTQGHGSYGTRLYVCGPANAMHVSRVLFRDWLRYHPADAAEYATLKIRLAEEAKGDWRYYTNGKASFVSRIVNLALPRYDGTALMYSGPRSAMRPTPRSPITRSISLR